MNGVSTENAIPIHAEVIEQGSFFAELGSDNAGNDRKKHITQMFKLMAATGKLVRVSEFAKAKELIFSGKTIGAQEAKEIGLVNAVYAPEELLNGAIAMAQSFTANAPIAVKYSKACIDRGMQMDIDDGIALENELFAMCYATADQKEGMGAFLEKRKEKHFQNK